MRRFVLEARNEINRLLGYIRRRVALIDDAEDLLQETLVALLEKVHLGVVIEDPVAWLYGTARHKIVDWYRRKSLAPVSIDRDGPASQTEAADLWELADAAVATPQEEAEREELRQVILDALDALPDDQRQVFLQTEVDGLTVREVHDRTGVPINTLLSRKRYAVLKLRKALAQWVATEREA